jgi:hypothetical protein
MSTLQNVDSADLLVSSKRAKVSHFSPVRDSTCLKLEAMARLLP